jgi:cytosine/adenosine deaminase-related metal-dependent hydrolase
LVTPASSALEAVEVIMQAYASSGMRAVLSLEILPSKLNALEPHSSSSTKEIIRIYDDVLARWHNSLGGRLHISLAPQESLLDQPDFVSWLSEVSLNQKIATYYHFNQTKS